MNAGLDIFRKAQRLQGVQHFQEGEQTVSEQEMINRLGYDPGNPYNNLTRGFNSGVPTQRGVGMAANIGGNFIFPGFGTAVLGPGASWFTRWLQGFLGRQNVQNAVTGSQTPTDTSTQPTDSGTTDTSGGDTDTSGQTSTSTGTGGGYGSQKVWDPYGSSFLGGFDQSPQAWPGPSSTTNIGNLGTNAIGGGGYFVNSSGPISDSPTFFPTLGSANVAASGGGGANVGGAASGQLRQIMKGIFSPMTGAGYAPLGGFTGTGMGSAQGNMAAQRELQQILMSNPGLMGAGPTIGFGGGGAGTSPTRGTPMRQSFQKGSSDIGLRLFKKHQRLQGGSGDVKYTPVTPTKEYPYSTDYEFIHRKEPQGRDADLAHLTPEEEAQEQRDWEKNIKSILSITPDLTPEERNQVLQLNPKDWDDSTREKVGQANEKAGTDTQLAQGDEDVNPDPEAGQRMFALPTGFKPANKQSDDEWADAPRRPLTKKELLDEAPWMRDMIKSIPWREPFKGPQFNPRDVPEFQGEHGLYYDPSYSSSDLEVMAQKGTGNVMQTTGNNPGLKLFMHMQKLRRPTPMGKPQGYAKGSSGIHIDPRNKGKFTALQRETGKSTAELKNSPNPLTRKRANFAMMAKRHFKPLGE